MVQIKKILIIVIAFMIFLLLFAMISYTIDKTRKNETQTRSLSQNEKQALLDFCKQYNENVIEASFEELKEQGHFDEETMSLDGILITVDEVETIKENKAILRASKYRSGLGAIMPKYELKLENDNYWKLKIVDTMIS